MFVLFLSDPLIFFTCIFHHYIMMLFSFRGIYILVFLSLGLPYLLYVPPTCTTVHYCLIIISLHFVSVSFTFRLPQTSLLFPSNPMTTGLLVGGEKGPGVVEAAGWLFEGIGRASPTPDCPRAALGLDADARLKRSPRLFVQLQRQFGI
ncbi:hypothetical protein K491DRAFT_70427 [Lophiostoma macrostomum CBS 122681]|uniref:Uncharacterized protein n=1 Tax=Lophiostoma macrostomum CBS 122681 TaxID=1314788 RepID=A0A6A6SZT7_9PLEO|nr:hypothetical protein K491DRAFT_70427 [Lophiostoma macrostomum CBS 122681]